jgi:hypothetical protein
MTFTPEVPTTCLPPTRLDAHTWLIHQVQHALGAPLSVYLNSMVITGAQPVIIDTGSPNNRGRWLDDVFGVVDPVVTLVDILPGIAAAAATTSADALS